MTTNLKPCPFCDGRAELLNINGSYGYYEASAEVRCTGCGIQTPRVYDEDARGHRRKPVLGADIVMKKWNTRLKCGTLSV